MVEECRLTAWLRPLRLGSCLLLYLSRICHQSPPFVFTHYTHDYAIYYIHNTRWIQDAVAASVSATAALIAWLVQCCLCNHTYTNSVIVIGSIYTLYHKKEATWCLIITLANVDRFSISKFFTNWFVRKFSIYLLQRFLSHLQCCY